MIKPRNINKKILAYVMAFIISLTSLSAALAEGEVELTNDDAIETTIPDESKEEIGFSEIKEIESKSAEELMQFISEWYEDEEEIVDIYIWDEEERNKFLNALEFIANPANYFDAASTLVSEGIIMPNDSGNGILDTNCNLAYSFFLYLLDASIEDKNFDVSAICCTEQNRNSYRNIVEPLRDLFSKKKLDIIELQQVYYSLERTEASIKNRMESLVAQGEDPTVAIKSVINEVIYCHLANSELFFKLDEIASKYPGKQVAQYLDISNPKDTDEVTSAIINCKKKECVVFNIDSDDPLEIILGVMENASNSFADFFRPYASIYDGALDENLLEKFQNTI